jgi:membrane-bound inhibitor of C-type lysozyme
MRLFVQARFTKQEKSMGQRALLCLLSATALIAAYSPVSAQSFVTYHCRDGSEFVVGFFPRDRRANVQLDGKAITLSKRISLSGSRYVKGDITLNIGKRTTTLRRGKRSTECTAM